MIFVRDQHSGIPAEVAERIFDPFFRTDASRDKVAWALAWQSRKEAFVCIDGTSLR